MYMFKFIDKHEADNPFFTFENYEESITKKYEKLDDFTVKEKLSKYFAAMKKSGEAVKETNTRTTDLKDQNINNFQFC